LWKFQVYKALLIDNMALSSHVRTESDRSDDEKGVRGTVEAVDMPIDPDAHLSAAERASIVSKCTLNFNNLEVDQVFRTENLCGSSTCI
jgi:hypothetical protein